jgi:hypothetical protein
MPKMISYLSQQISIIQEDEWQVLRINNSEEQS